MPNPENLIPFKKGDDPRRNTSGRPVGSFSLSTMIIKLEEELDWDKLDIDNKDEMRQRFGKRGFEALTYVAFSEALKGNVKAMEFIRKSGYGDKLDVTSKGKEITSPLIISKIEPRNDE